MAAATARANCQANAGPDSPSVVDLTAMNYLPFLRSLVLSVLLVSVWCTLPAQTAPNSPSNPPARDEVIQLSPFEVSAEANRGYVTTSALTASRIAVPITELPSTVITVNEKLIQDTLAVGLKDTLNYIGGLQSTGESNGQHEHKLSLRGNIIGTSQRDGVVDRMMSNFGGFDYSMFERIEIVKGPSGVLYGSSSPGGIINFISKRPLSRPMTRISTSVGSFNSYRADVDTSGFIGSGKTWGYRFAGAYADTDGPVDFAAEPEGGLIALNPSFAYRGPDGLQVWAWAAVMRDRTNRLNPSAHAYRTGPTSGRVLLRESADSHGNNIFRNLTKVDVDSYELGASRPFTTGPLTTTVRLLGRWYQQVAVGDRIRGVGSPIDMFLDSAGNLLGGDSRLTDYDVVADRMATIARSQIRLDGNRNDQKGSTYAADVVFAFDLGPTRHRLLGFATRDAFDGVSVNDTFTVSDPARLTALGATLVNGQVRIQVWPTPAPAMLNLEPQTVIDNAQAISRNTSNSDNELVSFGLNERMSVLGDRLFLVAGVRRDRLDTTAVQIVSNVAGPATDQNDLSTTRNYGLLGKVYQGERGGVSLYYNDNETFTPVFTRDTRLGASFGQRYPNRVAHIDEYGVKVDMFQSRLVATLALYDIAENNGLLQFHDETGSITGIPLSTYRAPVGVRTSKGWDVDLNFAPAPGWEVVLSYSKLETRLADTQLPAQESPEHTFGAIGRYEFTGGRLHGLSLMWMYHYWGESVLGSRTNWWLPSGDQHTAVIGYRRGRWNLRLRVENVFDKLQVMPSGFETAVGVTLNRNYRLGLSYEY